MKDKLELGTLTESNHPLTLPAESISTQTFACCGIRGSGKTCTALAVAEEMLEAGLPWIALDPVSVWRGLRSKPDGTPSNYPVVIVGGQYGDLPLDRDAGRKIAAAVVAENISVVIDLKQESKRFWHTFVTDFCLELMDQEPQVPRQIFIEEAPEFIPQKTKVELTARCKEAVERLVRLGRNQGYGCFLITQRSATVDKDVLSQCENFFMMRTTATIDRKVLKEWGEGKMFESQESEPPLSDLAGLKSGEAWFWSPEWVGKCVKVKIRARKTFHPGATRTVGQGVKGVKMAEIPGFVDRLKTQLSKKQVSVARSAPAKQTTALDPSHHAVTPDEIVRTNRAMEICDHGNEIEALKERLDATTQELRETKARLSESEARVKTAREFLEGDYQKSKLLARLYEKLAPAVASGGVDRAAYDPWIEKAKKVGATKMLMILMERPAITKVQLATLAGVTLGAGTWHAYFGWLKRNQLIEVEGDGPQAQVRLRSL